MEFLRQIWNLNTPYVKPKEHESLRRYVYRGSDNSLVYRYFYRPLSIKIVSFLPNTLALVQITVASLLCVFIPHAILFTVYDDVLQGDIPNWLLWLTLVLFFIYNVLDNIDGQQARKTGASSPLGLLFDHQIDALIAFIFSISMLRILQMGQSRLLSLSFCTALIPFFYTTLEQYYVGGLYLPSVNLVSDGPLILEAVVLITIYKGTEFWKQEINFMGTGPLMLGETTALCSVVGQIIPIIRNVINILKENPGKRRLFFANLGIFNTLMFSMVLVGTYSNCKIMRVHPIAFFYMYGLSFVKITAHIQIAHVCDSKFHPFRKPILLLSGFMFINTALGWAFDECLFRQDRMLFSLLFMTIVAYVHLVVHVINEMTTILGIRCFIIKPKE